MAEHQSSLSVALTSMNPDLAAALVDAQGRVEWVGKDGKNKFHGYNYATAEDLIGAARQALNASGLATFHSWRSERYECVITDGSKETPKLAIGRVVAQYVVVHRSGACLAFETSTPVVPEKGKPEDKSEQAALTSNLAYSLRGLLLIPRGEAPEESVDGRNEDEPAERRPPRLEVPADDVPFEVGPNDKAAISRSPAVARVEHPDVEIVKAAIAALTAAQTIATVVAQLVQAESMPYTPYGMATLQRAAAQRMLSIAASVPELAGVGEFLKKMRSSGNGNAEWHEGAAKAYKARRAELTK